MRISDWSSDVFSSDLPNVLKPVNEGSSVGVAIVTDESNYGQPISRDAAGPWQTFDRLLAEPFIAGRELTVAVLGEEALAVTELVPTRSEEHTSELQSLMRISYAVFCSKKKNTTTLTND